MSCWIFQVNPQRFDIDGLMATRPTTMTWLVTRHADQISTGDQVFLWRSIGRGDAANSGIVAELEVIEAPRQRQTDSASRVFWADKREADRKENRALLRVRRVARSRELIRRDWVQGDPILRDLTILKMGQASNYSVSARQARRLNSIWSRVGIDWSRSESIAGLWAYSETFGAEVSRLPGTPASKVAVLTGRVIAGVYNKIMNFRALDPRDPRTGMRGVGSVDREVWGAYYDASLRQLRREALNQDFSRLWPETFADAASNEAEAFEEASTREVQKLRDLSLDALLRRYESDPERSTTDRAPQSRVLQSRKFDRSPNVTLIALKRAGYRCEVQNCRSPTFETVDGTPYCEVHHILPLSEGGGDTPKNVAAVCPFHHREVHHGKEKDRIKAQLLARREEVCVKGPNLCKE